MTSFRKKIPCLLCFPLLALCPPGRAQIEAVFVQTLLDSNIGASPLSHPLALSADQNDNLYLADTGNHRLIKFNLATGQWRETGGFGFRNEEFDRPVDLWAANGLDVWVADYNNRRVKRYDKDLNFVAAFYPDPAYGADLQFGYPAAVTLSLQGELFLADHDFNRVLRFDIFGAPKAGFGDFNWGAGRLERPAKLLTLRNGEIWASDSLLHALMRYDAYGNFLGQIGADLLTQPVGMAEWRDRILVADAGRHRILVFDKSGGLLAQFGKAGRGPDEIFMPVDVAVLREQQNEGENRKVLVAVLDTGNSRVQLFLLSMRTAE